MPSTGLSVDEFVRHRQFLAGLAYRMLGSWHDAEDVLQEAYVRWSGVDHDKVAEPRRYLTRVVTRLAVDSLRARQARRENYVGDWLPEPVPVPVQSDPFGGVESDLSMAMLHLMEQLTPPQRAVYVLRTAFVLPYDEIAGILGRTAEDCRQLHKRAAAALEKGRSRFEPTKVEQQRLLLDFVAAARDGDLPRLQAMLRDDVTSWNDGGGKAPTARKPVHGSEKVAHYFTHVYSRRKRFDWAPVDLLTGPAIYLHLDQTRHLLTLQIEAGQVIGVRVVANPEKLSALG